MWDSPDAGPSTANSFRTIEEQELIQGLMDAAEADDMEAIATLASKDKLAAYLAKFH